MAKKTLYLAFPICDDFQRHDLDRKTYDELFELFISSQRLITDGIWWEDIETLFESLNSELIESINFWFYKIEIDEVKFNEWYNN